MNKKEQLKELQIIPGVGPIIAQDLWNIGIKSVADLKRKDPRELYLKICTKKGYDVDPCVLYVCRLSVYFAENEKLDPKKLKWWNWKDEK